jgi:hypothetical protein
MCVGLETGRRAVKTCVPTRSVGNENETRPQPKEITMRFMLKVNIPVDTGNALAKSGKLGSTIQTILTEQKPEAVYFTDSDGERTGYLIVDMQDASQIPALCEPWFLSFDAGIEIHPVMIPEDLAKAGAAIERAVKKYA